MMARYTPRKRRNHKALVRLWRCTDRCRRSQPHIGHCSPAQLRRSCEPHFQRNYTIATSDVSLVWRRTRRALGGSGTQGRSATASNHLLLPPPPPAAVVAAALAAAAADICGSTGPAIITSGGAGASVWGGGRGGRGGARAAAALCAALAVGAPCASINATPGVHAIAVATGHVVPAPTAPAPTRSSFAGGAAATTPATAAAVPRSTTTLSHAPYAPSGPGSRRF